MGNHVIFRLILITCRARVTVGQLDEVVHPVAVGDVDVPAPHDGSGGIFHDNDRVALLDFFFIDGERDESIDETVRSHSGGAEVGDDIFQRFPCVQILEVVPEDFYRGNILDFVVRPTYLIAIVIDKRFLAISVAESRDISTGSSYYSHGLHLVIVRNSIVLRCVQESLDDGVTHDERELVGSARLHDVAVGRGATAWPAGPVVHLVEREVEGFFWSIALQTFIAPQHIFHLRVIDRQRDRLCFFGGGCAFLVRVKLTRNCLQHRGIGFPFVGEITFRIRNLVADDFPIFRGLTHFFTAPVTLDFVASHSEYIISRSVSAVVFEYR